MNGLDLCPDRRFAFLGKNGPLLLELADHVQTNLVLRIRLLKEEALVLALNLYTNGRLKNVGLLVVKEKAGVGLFKSTNGLLKDCEIGILGKHLLKLSGKSLKLVKKGLEEDATRCHCVYCRLTAVNSLSRICCIC